MIDAIQINQSGTVIVKILLAIKMELLRLYQKNIKIECSYNLRHIM